MSFRSVLLAGLVIAVVVSPSLAAPASRAASVWLNGRGNVTWYQPGNGITACGDTPTDADYVAAVAPTYWTAANRNADPLCGAVLAVTDADSHLTVTARIRDMCPSCGVDRIELSRNAFAVVAEPSAGITPATWHVSAVARSD
jgi:expansin (peptidoglycan-binding protein)